MHGEGIGFVYGFPLAYEVRVPMFVSPAPASARASGE